MPPPGLTFPPETSQVFGGEASVVSGVDVSVYASGLRNPYDVVWTTQGLLYATDNGPNEGFGDVSTGPDTQAPATHSPDELNLLTEGAYYGHPNRNRGATDARQNVYHGADEPDVPGVYTAPLATADSSTNGVVEYRAETFGGQLRGALLAQEWNGSLFAFDLAADGQSVVNTVSYEGVASGLDVVTGPGGAILGIDYSGNQITVATPVTSVAAPIAYDVYPWRAPASGGVTFMIGGENFGDVADTTVVFGGQAAALTEVAPNRIVGVTPALPATGEFVDVVVTSAGAASVLADAYLPLQGEAPTTPPFELRINTGGGSYTDAAGPPVGGGRLLHRRQLLRHEQSHRRHDRRSDLSERTLRRLHLPNPRRQRRLSGRAQVRRSLLDQPRFTSLRRLCRGRPGRRRSRSGRPGRVARRLRPGPERRPRRRRRLRPPTRHRRRQRQDRRHRNRARRRRPDGADRAVCAVRPVLGRRRRRNDDRRHPGPQRRSDRNHASHGRSRRRGRRPPGSTSRRPTSPKTSPSYRARPSRA